MDIKKLQPLLQAKGISVSDDDFIFTFLSLYEVEFEDMFDGTLEDLIEKSPAFNGMGTKKFNIKKMQSILLSKGIRIGNDDPVFAMLGLNKIILENIADTYRQKLKREHVHRLSIESAKKEKIAIYLSCLIITILAFFGGKNIEWLRQSLIGIGGMALGAGYCLLTLKEGKSNPVPAGVAPQVGGGASLGQLDGLLWTDAEFSYAVEKAPHLSKRTTAACRDVLIYGLDASTVATKAQLNLGQLTQGLWALQESKRKM